MSIAAPPGTRCTSEHYFALIDAGVLGSDDKVELLEGVIVAMAPEGPRHEVGIDITAEALRVAVAGRAVVRVQHSVHTDARSVPEPDVAVVAGRHADYVRDRPRSALLVVEVAKSSLARDRRKKARIYAAAGIPEYWIVNLRDDVIEVSRSPDREAGRYTETRIARRGERLELVALPGASVAVDDLLPER
jgi:Uma2 family endonuclease